jgi:hypothetical protein
MLVDGRAFDGLTHMMETQRRLRSDLGYGTCFSEFQLQNVDNIDVIRNLTAVITRTACAASLRARMSVTWWGS